MAKSNKPLPPGTEAPDFTLKVTPDQTVTLSDFLGQPVLGVCRESGRAPAPVLEVHEVDRVT